MSKKRKDLLAKTSIMQECEEVADVTTEPGIEEVSEEIKEDSMVKMSVADRILDTKQEFGKCRVVVDELKVLTRSSFLRTGIETILKAGDTFYFDKIHTTKQNLQYVSWSAANGKRSYALFKNLNTGDTPVVRIEA